MIKTILTEQHVRVIGSMIEKQITTPMNYPMSPNAVKVACNQKSNRDPVVEYDDNEVFDILHGLQRIGYIESGLLDYSRNTKYRQLFSEVHELERGELVIMCELFIRGPQTPGELRSRCERMYKFKDLADVERCLKLLSDKQFVLMLERLPGTKENRWAQLFCGKPKIPAPAPHAPAATPSARNDLGERVANLEQQLRQMEERLSALEHSRKVGSPA